VLEDQRDQEIPPNTRPTWGWARARSEISLATLPYASACNNTVRRVMEVCYRPPKVERQKHERYLTRPCGPITCGESGLRAARFIGRNTTFTLILDRRLLALRGRTSLLTTQSALTWVISTL
jgi:hypothetical protein